jgi:drug/metabolite transporter (DMT)-like permease
VSASGRAGARTDAGAAGAGLIILAATCFGTLGPISRFAADAGVEPLGLVAWRSGIGTLCMVVFVALTRRSLASLRVASIPGRQRRFLLGAAAANALLNTAIFIAFGRVSIALALLVFYLYPAFVAIASMMRFGDRTSAGRWAALGISLLGMVLVVASGAELNRLDVLGLLLALCAAVAQAFYVLAARHGFGSVGGAEAGALTTAAATVLVVVAGLVIGQGAVFVQPAAGGNALLAVLVAGTIGAGIPTVAFISGIRLIGAPRGAILATLEPVVGVVLAALLLGEVPGPLQIVGGILIIVAAILLQLQPEGGVAEHEALAGS